MLIIESNTNKNVCATNNKYAAFVALIFHFFVQLISFHIKYSNNCINETSNNHPAKNLSFVRFLLMSIIEITNENIHVPIDTSALIHMLDNYLSI